MSDVTIELEKAIKKLEAFSIQRAAEKKQPPILKTISLMRALLVDRSHNDRQKKQKESNPSTNELLQAVEMINRERFLIQKLQKGTPAEQKLAESFAKVISIYNEILDQPLENKKIIKIFKIFSKKLILKKETLPKIDLPQKHSIEYRYSESPAKIDGKRFSLPTAQLQTDIGLPQQSIELFHMKTISLLERYGIATNSEARLHIKQTPIHTVLEEDHPKCTLSQTLTLFPGQIIRIIGTSEYDPKTRKIQKISPETFAISLESDQTGFPHALQRAGWTLAHPLIHGCPQRIDLLRETAEILKKKKFIANTLLPHTQEIEKAKQLIRMKRKVFVENKHEFLALHKQLATSIAKAAGVAAALESIDLFYFSASNHPQAYEWVSCTHQMLSEYFILTPHQTFFHSILNEDFSKFARNDLSTRYKSASSLYKKILQETQMLLHSRHSKTNVEQEQIQLNYMETMGKIVGESSMAVALQYLSEDLMFQPPMLTSFDCKIQAAAYQHVAAFFEELSLPPLQTSEGLVYQLMMKEMEYDIALFEGNQKFQIPQELYTYFELRHHSLNAHQVG